MILLTVDEIISIHEKLVEATGGSKGLRDKGLLESAVYSADASFGDVEMYPTVMEKAAYAISSASPEPETSSRSRACQSLFRFHLVVIPCIFSFPASHSPTEPSWN